MRIAPPGVTNPEAGVIATRPATAPQAAPTTLTLRWWRYAAATQVIVAAAAAVLVAMKALAARPPAVPAQPAVKANHPNHRRAPPRTVIRKSCGADFPALAARL